MLLNLNMKDQKIPTISVQIVKTIQDNSNTKNSHDEKDIKVDKDMESWSNKYKEDAKYPGETKKLIKRLIMLNLQNNVFRFTLKHLLYFETKIIEAKKYDVTIKTSEKWNH